jgi:hypothetical protein
LAIVKRDKKHVKKHIRRVEALSEVKNKDTQKIEGDRSEGIRTNVRRLNSGIHFTESQDRFAFKCLVLVMYGWVSDELLHPRQDFSPCGTLFTNTKIKTPIPLLLLQEFGDELKLL